MKLKQKLYNNHFRTSVSRNKYTLAYQQCKILSGAMAKNEAKETNKSTQGITQKTKDEATRTPQKTGVILLHNEHPSWCS